MKCALGIFQLILIKVLTVSADSWNYNVLDWPGLCQTGTFQSPIDLVDSEVIAKDFPTFKFSNYDISNPATVKNNGHSAAITLNTTTTPTLSGGGLPGKYLFHHFHFHWESEHTVNGERYPLEMHLVHYSSQYKSLSEAAANANGIAVLGVFFERSIDNDDDFTPLTDVMQKVYENPNTQVNLEKNIAAKNFLPRNRAHYYRYIGSLTTPECNEGVIWTVFTETLPISSDQLENFKGMWTTSGARLVSNYRPVQPLNGRVISLRSIPSVKRANKGVTISASFLTILLLSMLPFVKCEL